MRPLDRREFLRLVGVTAASATIMGCSATPWASWTVPVRTRRDGPLRLGVVGVGGRGAGNLAAVSQETIVALCDVDTRPLAAAAERHPGAATFRDHRVMLAESELDGIVISTPDHMHAPIAMAALQRGLDVYCEKPLGRRTDECLALQRAAAHMGAVTQMGTQIHVGHHREWLDACRTRGPTTCGFDYAARLTRAVLAGVEAYRTGASDADTALAFS